MFFWKVLNRDFFLSRFRTRLQQLLLHPTLASTVRLKRIHTPPLPVLQVGYSMVIALTMVSLIQMLFRQQEPPQRPLNTWQPRTHTPRYRKEPPPLQPRPVGFPACHHTRTQLVLRPHLHYKRQDFNNICRNRPLHCRYWHC